MGVRVRPMLMRVHLTSLALSLAVAAITGCMDRPVTDPVDPQTGPATTVLPSGPTPIPVLPSTLAGAITDWISLLEADDLPNASQRWAMDDEAKVQMERFWPKLRACHQQYDYRQWLDAAGGADGAESFAVGGHNYGHMHTDWTATPSGWRIGRVWMCR